MDLTLSLEIDRFDAMASLMEKIKIVILSLVIMLKRSNDIENISKYIQTTRNLSIELTAVFEAYKRLERSHGKLTELENEYVELTCKNFISMISNNLH